MADQPPPYPGNEKAGYPPPQGYPPQPQPGAYPPQPQPGAYQPQPGAYPPPQAGYGGQPGYGGQAAGYPPPNQADYKNPGPPGAYPPNATQQSHAQTTVVVSQPAVPVVLAFHGAPLRTMCPHCRADVMTAIQYESGTLSWVLCIVLCLIGCNLGCCLIPFCAEGCQDVVHSCPNCHQQIGRWSRM